MTGRVICGLQPVAYFTFKLMEMCDALQSASAQAIYDMPQRLAAVVGAQQEYTFGLLFGTPECKDVSLAHN